MADKTYISKKYLISLYKKGGIQLIKEKLTNKESLIFTDDAGEVLEFLISNNTTGLEEFLTKI